MREIRHLYLCVKDTSTVGEGLLMNRITKIITAVQPTYAVYLDVRETFIGKKTKTENGVHVSRTQTLIEGINTAIEKENAAIDKNLKIIVDCNQEVAFEGGEQRIVNVLRHAYSSNECIPERHVNCQLDANDVSSNDFATSKFAQYAISHSMFASQIIKQNSLKTPIPLWLCFKYFVQWIFNKKKALKMGSDRELAAPIAYRALLNCLLGFAFVWAIEASSDEIKCGLRSFWDGIHNHKLRQAAAWLESYPLGFKLNIELTASFGRQIDFFLIVQNDIVAFIANSYGYAIKVCLSLVAGLLGAEAFLCFLFDMTAAVTLHVYLLSQLLRRLFRFQLGTLSSLWLLFRGKKKNILRKRNDTMDYDSMQLLFGMFLFCIVVFLFTTFLVYYAFFCMVEAVVLVMLSINFICIMSIKESPVYKTYRRITTPGSLCKEIYFAQIEESLSECNNLAPYAELILIPESPIEILRDAYKNRAAVLFATWKSFFTEVVTCRPFTARKMLVEGNK